MAHNPAAFRLDIQAARTREFEAAQTAAEVKALDERWRIEDQAVERAQSAQARQAADHERRLVYVEEVLEEQVPKLLELVIGTLRKEMAEVEAKQLKFYGVHEPGRSYAPNSMVVKKGGLWIALTATGTVPGSDDSWQLAVKSGEAGKAPAVA
jgi:hypothetical protein